MDPLSPDNALDNDPADSPPSLKREQGLAPAGSLMSIQVRRRMPAKDRLLGPPAPSAPHAPAPRVVRPAPPLASEPAKPQAPVAQTAPDAIPATTSAAPAAMAPEPPPTPAPAPTAAPAPAPAAPPAAMPDVAAPESDRAAPAPSPTPAMGEPGRRTPATRVSASAPAAPPVVSAPSPSPAPSAPPAPAAPSALTSPGIARYARTSEDGRRPESKPAQDIPPAPAAPSHTTSPPAPSATRPGAPAPTPEPVRPQGIVSYWLRLRGSRRYPSKADLDQKRIAADWPNSILMRCRSGSKVLEPEKVFASPHKVSSGLPGSESPAAMELSPMMLQWLLTLAEDAAQDRRPMQDTETFPSLNKNIRYGAFALPFSDDQTRIDHVLCHVYRTP